MNTTTLVLGILAALFASSTCMAFDLSARSVIDTIDDTLRENDINPGISTDDGVTNNGEPVDVGAMVDGLLNSTNDTMNASSKIVSVNVSINATPIFGALDGVKEQVGTQANDFMEEKTGDLLEWRGVPGPLADMAAQHLV